MNSVTSLSYTENMNTHDGNVHGEILHHVFIYLFIYFVVARCTQGIQISRFSFSVVFVFSDFVVVVVERSFSLFLSDVILCG